MGAIINGLLDILGWLSGTASSLFTWLVQTVQALAGWFWNALLDVLFWFVDGLFWVISILVVFVLDILTLLVGLLPQMPSGLDGAFQYLIPAFNVANQLFPLSEAIALGSLWLTVYGVMAIWRVVTFLRGGR